MQLDELSELAAEVREAQQHCEHCVRVCMAAGCQSSGAKAVLESLTEKAAQADHVCVKGVGCMGLCAAGPLVEVASRARRRA